MYHPKQQTYRAPLTFQITCAREISTVHIKQCDKLKTVCSTKCHQTMLQIRYEITMA